MANVQLYKIEFFILFSDKIRKFTILEIIKFKVLIANYYFAFITKYVNFRQSRIIIKF